MVGNWGEVGKCGIVYWVVDYPGFPIPMQSWNPSVRFTGSTFSGRLCSPIGLGFQDCTRIARLIKDCVAIVLGLWLVMGASSGLRAILT